MVLRSEIYMNPKANPKLLNLSTVRRVMWRERAPEENTEHRMGLTDDSVFGVACLLLDGTSSLAGLLLDVARRLLGGILHVSCRILGLVAHRLHTAQVLVI